MKIFTKVHCKAYMKKISDGVHIQIYNKKGELAQSHREWDTATAYKDDTEIADLSGWCGESVEKEYRERVEKSFNGFLVGYTHIKVKGLIGTDLNYDFRGVEHLMLFKEITEKPKVAVVFFKNNCKRYVLLEDLEEYEGFKPDSNAECPIEGQVTFEDFEEEGIDIG